MVDAHKQDHDRILDKLNENSAVWKRLNELSGLEKDILLANERIQEMKADKEKSTAWSQRLASIAAGLIMALGGGAINSYSTQNVLQEKIKEQKTEITGLKEYITDVDAKYSDGFADIYEYIDGKIQ